jgi:hypothetical protein
MSSILKVDEIQDTSGNNIINENANTVTIGKSGDTVNVVGTLQNGGTNFLQGITMADQWRLTANLTNPGTADITANLERVDDASFAKIGTGMTESSGIFSFPSTGLYCVNYKVSTQSTTDFHNAYIYVTSDGGSTYDKVTEIFGGHNISDLLKQDAFSQALINVTNISNIKVKFNIDGLTVGSVLGSTAVSRTAFTFIRLGDSQ